MPSVSVRSRIAFASDQRARRVEGCGGKTLDRLAFIGQARGAEGGGAVRESEADVDFGRLTAGWAGVRATSDSC